MGWKRNEWAAVEVGLTWALMLGMMVQAGKGQGSSAAAASAIATTAVTDTVYRADGTAAGGTVLISWPAFATAAGRSVPAGSTSVTIGAGGVLNVALVPNAGSNPMGSYYTVLYHLNDGSVTREYWVVPVSATPVAVSVIRSTVLPLSVAMQTVSKSYVDSAISAASGGSPLDNSPYVLKAGDTMTGPLTLPGDPTAPLQAAEKQYVDAQIAGVSGGNGQKVSLLPQGTQVVAQPPGTQLEANNLNGALYAGQYGSGAGNNGVANAAGSADCVSGCDIRLEGTNSSTEVPSPTTWRNKTQLDDHRRGAQQETYLNPGNAVNPGINIAHSIALTSTETAPQILAEGGGAFQFWTGLDISSIGLTGGTNEYPTQVQGTIPYFKTEYGALALHGVYNTPGQHVLSGGTQNCYGVGDCIMGGYYMVASGGFRDSGDEGSHPFDLEFSEDPMVFVGSCGTGCTPGSTTVQISATQGPGTQGEGRYLIDKNPSKVLTAGMVTGGSSSFGGLPQATFSGTNFPVSVFLETAQTISSQPGNLAPGTVTVSIVTGAVPGGYATNTAALPATNGVVCVSDLSVSDGRPTNFETGTYLVVDGTHLRMTLRRPHSIGATLAVGGLCGYGVEQTADTQLGIRQVFPVIGSSSATQLFYAGGLSSLLGVQHNTSAFSNVNVPLFSLARSGGVVTATMTSPLFFDLNALTLTISGVTDPSYNGSYAVSTTGAQTFTYVQAGADSTSTGGTASFQNGSYVLYPMAEIVSVYNQATKAVDGQMTLAPNTAAWGPGDVVEVPHYFQEKVFADQTLIMQTTPRPSLGVEAGVSYGGNNGPGLSGWGVENTVPASQYFGNGGTHSAPTNGMSVTGVWTNSLDVEAGENAAVQVHCNSHGCDKWNSGYSLFRMDTGVGQDALQYQPASSALTFVLRGTQYGFTPQGLTAGTANVGTLNVGTIHASSIQGPISNAVNGGLTTTGPINFASRSTLIGEYLLTEGSGVVAHDTSGLGNDATISGATWEGTTDLNFTAQGQYIQLPTALNGAKAWQFAIYAPKFGAATGPGAPGYGDSIAQGTNPSLLCGTDLTHLCLIAGTGKMQQFAAYTTDGTESAQVLTSGWHIVTFLCGSNVGGVVTKTHILYDGTEVGGYVNQGDANTCPNPASGNYQIGGSSILTGTWWLGKVAAAWAWSTPLSLSNGVAAAKSAMDYIRSKGVQTEFGKIPHAAPMILGGTDSRTYGVGVATGTGWLQTMNLTDSSYTRLNLGFPGAIALDSCAMFDLTFGPYLSAGSAPVVTVLWGGVNDFLFTNQSSRQVANNLRCMVQKAKAGGSRVVLATEISSISPQGPAGDAGKNGLNAILRAEAFGWGVDNLADLATDAHLGADGASGNTACFPDSLHPDTACEVYITAIMQNAVNELLGSTERMRSTTASPSYQEVAGDGYLDLTGTSAQTVTLPDCTGYSLSRQMVNLGAAGATVSAVSGQTLSGSGAIAVGTKAVFLPIPGPLATAGCHWERTQ